MPLPPLPRYLTRLPIFTQVMGLCVFVLIISILINIALVVLMPPPKPSGYTLNEAARALSEGQVKLRNGRTLKTETLSTPPAFIREKPPHPFGENSFEQLMRQRLAQSLRVPESRVFIDGRPDFRRNRFGPDRMVFRLPDQGPRGPGFQGAFAERDGRPNMGPLSAPPPGETPDGATLHRMREAFLINNLPPGFNEQITFPAFRAALQLPDGHYRSLIPPRQFPEPWQVSLLLGFLLSAALIAPLAWLLSRRLTQPIAALAEGAAKLEFDRDAEPLKESGPAEVRRATQVLNAMQVRIRQHVESRTAVIAAIAHDLKTPLARLRLRIESLPAKERDKIAQDIAHMDSLIRSAMTFASADKMAQNVVRLDLSALAESLAEDMADLHNVQMGPIEPGLTVMADSIAMKRILCNLFENAHRYAGGSRLSVQRDGDQVVVTLSDDGPGVPEEALEAVFEPFHRLESSRNRDTGGAGLGLSVARALAEAHQGALTLRNRVTDGRVEGLDAHLILPLA
ncbi:HAMP domain-containing sensor histidine kinase [Asticcacaulis excentricus]|uniref:histidine kinase n=1 Tax=Asticcacaulis excentricus TaxID=78587 RepID=A0A3G9G7L9_9CAUL|nr:ATP-binding protein [Asticcacaulis excentricus]BBF80298.1 sensor histidine kinase [Asticcacaulis excentricus]